jgi:hypothetical protein
LGVPKDSKSPTLGVWISSSHLAKVGLRHFSNNRRRGVQDIAPGNRTTNWVNERRGQNCKDKYTNQNYETKGGYITTCCYIGGDYRDYSKQDRCLKGYEIFSFHFLSFYKDFGDGI